MDQFKEEEKLKKQEASLKVKESENEEYNNIAEQMLRMQIEIEKLKKENEDNAWKRNLFALEK